MPEPRPQTLQNHARFDPLFHFFLFPLSALMTLAAIWHAIRDPEFVSIWLAIAAVLLTTAAFRIRTYPLKVQDRVIRLEEKLRLAALLTAPDRDTLDSMLSEISEKQWTAL